MVSKNGCPACAYNTPILSSLMEKFERKGLAAKVPFFKMSSENTVPHLGSFNYTPIFLYLRKKGNEITEIFTMKPPAKPEFVSQLSELSGNPEIAQIVYDPHRQLRAHYQMTFLNKGFDVDFDLTPMPEEWLLFNL